MAHMLLLEYKKKYNVEGGKQSCIWLQIFRQVFQDFIY